jgi:hypothetical protein
MQLPQQQQQPSHTAHDPTPHLTSADSTAGGLDPAAAAAAGAAAAANGHVMSVEVADAAKQQGPPAEQQQGQQQPAVVVVPACGADCQHTLTQGWCHSQVGSPSCGRSVVCISIRSHTATDANTVSTQLCVLA